MADSLSYDVVHIRPRNVLREFNRWVKARTLQGHDGKPCECPICSEAYREVRERIEIDDFWIRQFGIDFIIGGRQHWRTRSEKVKQEITFRKTPMRAAATVHFQDGSAFSFTHDYQPEPPTTWYRSRLGELERFYGDPETSLTAFYTQIKPLHVIKHQSSPSDLTKTAMLIERELARLGNRSMREFKWIRNGCKHGAFGYQLDAFDKPVIKLL